MAGLFFSDHVVDVARAKAMCALCPLAQQCLDGALEREEPWGVWGGQLLSGGRIIADKRPSGRPPKNPGPEVIYDEMGPVGATLISALLHPPSPSPSLTRVFPWCQLFRVRIPTLQHSTGRKHPTLLSVAGERR